MAHTQLRPAPLAKVAGLGNLLSSAERNPEYSDFPLSRQADIDVVGILASRSGVAAATVRAQLAAWRIGGANG